MHVYCLLPQSSKTVVPGWGMQELLSSYGFTGLQKHKAAAGAFWLLPGKEQEILRAPLNCLM